LYHYSAIPPFWELFDCPSYSGCILDLSLFVRICPN
jgi:hypothetical protein